MTSVSRTHGDSKSSVTSICVCASVEAVTSTIVTDCHKGQDDKTASGDKINSTVKGLQGKSPFESISSPISELNGDTLVKIKESHS